MKTNPLPHHMRIAALQCNFEGGPGRTLAVPRRWQRFGFNVEQLFHTHSELYSAVFNRRQHGSLLRRYVAESRKNGISIILYMNCHILLRSQQNKAAQWAMVEKDGSYSRLYGTYYGCCVNSTWVDFFLKSIEDLKPFDIAGIFFDGPAGGPCYCARCAAKFARQYGTPLTKASPDQVAEFALQNSLNFMKLAYRKVKDVNPGWLAYYNMSLLHSNRTAAQMREALDCNDIIGTEGGFQFYGPPKDVEIWRCGLSARMVEATAGDRPKVIFMAGDHKPWSWYLHTPAETKLCYASTLANGSSVWYGIHCSTSHLDSPAGQAARAMVQFDRKFARLYEKTVSLADVAMFYSFNTAKHYTSSGEQTDFYRSGGTRAQAAIGNYSESVQGAYGLLFRSAIPCDMVTELNLQDIDRYRVLVVPTGACMDGNTGEAMKNFVARGGILIADSETSLFDASGRKRRDFLLSDLFGVSLAGYRKYNAHDYFGLDSKWNIIKEPGIPLIPAPLVGLDVKTSRDSEILARLCPPLAGRYSGRPAEPAFPFVIRRPFGKGAAYYFAGTFFELYRQFGIVHYRRIIESIVRRHSRPAVELLEAPESVEFTVREVPRSGERVVHLVNYTGGMTRPVERVVPVSGASLRVRGPVSSCRALVSGKKLTVSRDGTVALPDVQEFEVITFSRG